MGILFVLAALAFPAFALSKHEKRPVKRPYIYALLSFVFCMAALLSGFVSMKAMVMAGDYGGIEDIIGAVIMVYAAAAVFVLIINALMLGLYYEKE